MLPLFFGELPRVAMGGNEIARFSCHSPVRKRLGCRSAAAAFLFRRRSANDARFRDVIRKGGMPYLTTDAYLMPARPSYERDPGRVQAIWNDIRAVRASAEYRKLEVEAACNDNGN
ncbi:MAG TPA: hypothetical protein VF798_03830 [Burkholderiaceae bacterium]